MTVDQFGVYVRHPVQYLRSLIVRLQAKRLMNRAKGRTRKIMADLREMEANLRTAADPCCAKCYGRGHRGFNMTTKQWVICSCTYNPRTAEKCEEKPWLRC